MKKIKLAIVDDHLIFLEGMKMLFKNHEKIELVKVFSNGQLFLNYITTHPLDLVLMDISMPQMNGFECVKKMRESTKDIAVIGLSMHDEKQYIQAVVQADFNGYLLKNVALDVLETAIHEVYYGRPYFQQEVKKDLKVNSTDRNIDFDKITKREKEIIRLICQSKTSAQIGEALFIVEGTVKTHRKNILRKLQVNSTPELIQFVNNNEMLIFN